VQPVVVIGAGPVGQTAALLLARRRIPVLMLERRAERAAEGSRSICQQRDVLDIWAHAGAADIAAEGVTWTTARTFYQDREIGCWSFVDPAPSPLPPFVNISQSRTEQILDAAIAREELIEVRRGCEVTGLEQDGDGVTVCCGAVAVRTSYVVVAAGPRAGPLRGQLGIRMDGADYPDKFLICDIEAGPGALAGWADERRFYFDPPWNPGRQVLIHPCPDRAFRIDWQVPPAFDLRTERARGGLDARIRQIIPAAGYRLLWSSVYTFSERVADRMACGRVLLAGDCAHLVAPFGARGLNSGVQDAENAAWKIAFVLEGWAPPALIDSYHAERHPAALENLEVTGQTMRFLAPQDASGLARREELLRLAAADPDLAARVDSGRFAEPFWYAGSPLITPDPARPWPGRPARGQPQRPGPGVLIPDAPAAIDGHRRRLREVLRDGLTLLVSAGAAAAAHDELRAAVARVTDAPVRVLSLPEIDVTGALAAALGAAPGEVWLVRPDAHCAAVVTAAADAVTLATARALALGPPVASLYGQLPAQ
jgi:3-(3-hydroxy-phenyl)propionate hydroxylase